MANGAFDATLDVNNEIKVNNFDWSHANNLTTQIGRVTPVFCELVPAHGSVRINPRFGLQFMPMVFPIQTRLRARMMFFKYPLRALWDGYRDFVGNWLIIGVFSSMIVLKQSSPNNCFASVVLPLPDAP